MQKTIVLSALLGIAAIAQRVELLDPYSRFRDFELTLPPPGFPILQTDFENPPDCGEETYVGSSKLNGLNVLITGGDSGIGRAAVIALLREGANVAINYLPEEEPDAQDLVDFMAREDLNFTRMPGDLTNETFCRSLVNEAAERLGGLDIFIGNAGYSSLRNNRQSVSNLSTVEIQRVFTTNLFANFWLAGAALPHLPRGGSILFTVSNIAANPEPLQIDYGASKAALVHLTRSLAIQLAPAGVRVNAVAPGFTYSPILSSIGLTEEELPLAANRSAYGRVQQPAEMAPLYIDILDPLKTFTSGEVFTSSGGLPGP